MNIKQKQKMLFLLFWLWRVYVKSMLYCQFSIFFLWVFTTAEEKKKTILNSFLNTVTTALVMIHV